MGMKRNSSLRFHSQQVLFNAQPWGAAGGTAADFVDRPNNWGLICFEKKSLEAIDKPEAEVSVKEE